MITFLGLDPQPMDSGKKMGLHHLSKHGPAKWHHLLFNTTMSASHTKAWKATYEHEHAKGLPRTATLNMLTRKLMHMAFGLFKSGQHFNASTVTLT